MQKSQNLVPRQGSPRSIQLRDKFQRKSQKNWPTALFKNSPSTSKRTEPTYRYTYLHTKSLPKPIQITASSFTTPSTIIICQSSINHSQLYFLKLRHLNATASDYHPRIHTSKHSQEKLTLSTIPKHHSFLTSLEWTKFLASTEIPKCLEHAPDFISQVSFPR